MPDHENERAVLITWTRVGDGEVLVVATCKRCELIAERMIADRPDAGGLALLIGTEALARAGCTHTDATSQTRAGDP